ncbi:uncharacterized protein LOC133721155 [Rosa rugosa]|uniref:uncharacterized protein LOC133721155 n=1 Tax=Rosa rugosa TaxID=74645 RepID=UPI002B40E289|nr:uncharacterized protein LOC133721155 [Rosa rugosa]
MSILHTSLTHQHQSLSFSKSLTSPTPLFLSLSLSLKPLTPKPTFIRMGGGPRTFPGGVSKWQWKRMQAKKAKQLLKARLCRERQIYEMRKRAELKAAVSELERPWEAVEKPPNLFSVSADEQVKVLADRFQRPGGFDLWTERDGPELFRAMEDLPSARFFPKGVVHSVRPYRRIGAEEEDEGFGGVKRLVELGAEKGLNSKSSRMYNGKLRRKGKGNRGNAQASSDVDRKQRGQSSVMRSGENGNYRRNGGLKLNGLEDDRRSSSGYNSREGGVDRRQRGQGRIIRSGENTCDRRKGALKSKGSESEVFDMRLRQDGSYEFQ